jgi:hypothetical protein
MYKQLNKDKLFNEKDKDQFRKGTSCGDEGQHIEHRPRDEDMLNGGGAAIL